MTETGAQLFARLDARRCLADIEPHLFPSDSGPGRGEVVELHGLQGTGKTELLYHLLCRCVLPAEAGGLCVEVVFVDTDYSLDMLRLVTILENRLATGLAATGPEGRSGADGSEETVLRTCLSRLLVVHCSSSSQLLLTLHYLESSLSSRPGLSLLLLDSVSAFYWLDRCGGGESVAKQEDKLTRCSELLARLLREYRITVFATSHAVRRNYRNPSPASTSTSSTSSTSASEYDQPYLCRAWQRLVTHRLLCSRREAAPNMAAAAGTPEQRRRQVFTVHCTSFPSSNRTKAQKISSFHVTDGGVVFI